MVDAPEPIETLAANLESLVRGRFDPRECRCVVEKLGVSLTDNYELGERERVYRFEGRKWQGVGLRDSFGNVQPYRNRAADLIKASTGLSQGERRNCQQREPEALLD